MIEKVFRDPVHNYVHVDHQVIYDLINTKEFQRLRRIKQLGTSGYTFHGGEHSRFSHCLGAYEIARRITKIFNEKYSDVWDSHESLLTMTAALLHDLGHGAYSHTFERLFDTDHEDITRQIITSPETEIHQALVQVSPDFPEKVASVINHTYPNKQVVQLISSQIDVDRMDYLLRDSFFTGASYGQFDLTRILRVICPVENGIAFKRNGMHAVEDYVVSRYQMYMQVYFHPASRAMEVLLQNLLKRAKFLYPAQKDYFALSSPNLIPFFENRVTLQDYLALDDGVMNTYFQVWMTSPDKILSDLAQRFINRKVFKSIVFSQENETHLDIMRDLVGQVGFDPDYYTAIHRNFDLPYDFYRPDVEKPRTQIEILQKDGSRPDRAIIASTSPRKCWQRPDFSAKKTRSLCTILKTTNLPTENNMSIKLVAVDIDGTLVNNQKEITPEVFSAVQDAKAAGVKIVIATGRPIAGVKKLLEELKLNQPGNYVVTFNGGLVQDTVTGEELIKETLTYDDYLDIELLGRKLGVHMHAITKDGIYTANRNIGKYTVYESNLVNMPIFYRTPEEMADKEIVKCMYVDEPEILDAAIAKLPPELAEKYTLVKSAPFYLEIVKKTVNKGAAILHLAEKLGLSKEQTMAIGDEENDRAMLEAVGSPVVMENGREELKKIAKYITKSNEESGVAHAIREWVLK